MRQARLKIPPDRPTGFYHCLSRVVDRRFIFDPDVKEHFVALLRECEAFCQVRVLTFAVMSNHFHLLLEVPQRPASHQLPCLEAMLAKLRALSGHQHLGPLQEQIKALRCHPCPQAQARLLASLHSRLYDLSAFMKMLKQRFTQWYNRRTARQGTLWEERFKSVLVDGAGRALTTMAAYIDLNPVRARLVSDPKDYRWSGYGQAMAGRKRARLGVQQLVATLQGGRQESLSQSLATYRMHLFHQGHEERQTLGPDGRTVRGSFKDEEVLKVLQSKGRLGAGAYVRCKVRYFSDGAVLGSREFVDGIFRRYRGRFGPRRKTGARRLKGLKEPLFALRDLRLNVFG